MKDFLDSILPKRKGLSKKIITTSNLTGTSWTLSEEMELGKSYIFKSRNELIISIKGDVTIGKWELLEGTNSILIEVNQSKTLFKIPFLDKSVLILQKDGVDDFFPFYSKVALPDGDIGKYLKAKIIAKKAVSNPTKKVKHKTNNSFSLFSVFFQGLPVIFGSAVVITLVILVIFKLFGKV